MEGKHGIRAFAGTFVVLGLLTVAPVFAGQPDAWVTTKVKTQLILSPNVGGMPIDVDTNDGQVTLSGKVSTQTERTEAVRLAKDVGGVRAVRDLLQVVPSSKRKVVDAKDDQIQERVATALKAEPRLSNSSIHCKSVNQGVVVLDGKAASMSDHLLALEVAGSADGVRRVASEIESPDAFGDHEIWYDDSDKPGDNSSFTDAWITGKTKFKFMTDADIPATDINVDTHNGTVTLFGTVPNATVKQKAQQVAAATSGVKAVRNELMVVKPSTKKKVTADDAAIATEIRRRLADAGMDAASIAVEVKAGVARLTGTVARSTQRYDAVVIARTTDGVASVRDDMRVAPQG